MDTRTGIVSDHKATAPHEKRMLNSRMRPIPRVSKNAKCPCGSGKRFKNCHRTKA